MDPGCRGAYERASSRNFEFLKRELEEALAIPGTPTLPRSDVFVAAGSLVATQSLSARTMTQRLSRERTCAPMKGARGCPGGPGTAIPGRRQELCLLASSEGDHAW